MNIMIKDDAYSPQSSQRADFRLEAVLQKLAIKVAITRARPCAQPKTCWREQCWKAYSVATLNTQKKAAWLAFSSTSSFPL